MNASQQKTTESPQIFVAWLELWERVMISRIVNKILKALLLWKYKGLQWLGPDESNSYGEGQP